jgi:hypothetical protein
MTALAPSDPESRAAGAPSCQPTITTGHEKTKALTSRPLPRPPSHEGALEGGRSLAEPRRARPRRR